MLPESAEPAPQSKIDFRLIAAVLLLGVAAYFTWLTISGLSSRRTLRTELAEISHARYGVLNASRWVEIVLPILDARIDALDLKPSDRANLRPTVEKALNRLLYEVATKMGAPPAQKTGGGGFPGMGNSLMATLLVGALKPHVPEYADTVLAQLTSPDSKQALKKYVKSVLAEGAKSTFGKVDARWYSYILKEHGCADAAACQKVMGSRIRAMDAELTKYYLAVLGSSAVAFLLLMIGRPQLKRSSTAVLMLFCLVLLAGGVLTPMIEVEAKISRLGLTLLGQPIAFTDQVLYFQSKSVLEVFRTLITMGRPDMWIVGVLVLMFSIVFPILKIGALTLCLFRPALLPGNRVVRFFALESSKWSMADVMALAIFMSFVAFNGLIGNAMGGLRESAAALAIPTDSSKILPGYQLFIGFCLASLFLAKKLAHGIRTARTTDPA